MELFSHFDLCICQLNFITNAKVRNRNDTAGQLAMLSQALSKRESNSGCDPDEIYYQLNFYHFAVERQSGTGNCSPVTRKHYQKNYNLQMHILSCPMSMTKENMIKNNKPADAHFELSITKENMIKKTTFRCIFLSCPWQ